jgi:hypothetical protein
MESNALHEIRVALNAFVAIKVSARRGSSCRGHVTPFWVVFTVGDVLVALMVAVVSFGGIGLFKSGFRRKPVFGSTARARVVRARAGNPSGERGPDLGPNGERETALLRLLGAKLPDDRVLPDSVQRWRDETSLPGMRRPDPRL